MNPGIRRLSYALGAEITGIDIRKPIDDKMLRDVRGAFLEYGILLFRGQSLTSEQHVGFSRQFGDLLTNDDNPESRHREYPEILLVKSELSSKPSNYVGEYWHTDRVHECTPPAASLLRAVDIPEVGGDTMFANMTLAYDTLSDGMKQLIEGLHAIHIGAENITAWQERS